MFHWLCSLYVVWTTNTNNVCIKRPLCQVSVFCDCKVAQFGSFQVEHALVRKNGARICISGDTYSVNPDEYMKHSRPQFHLPPLGSLASWRRGDTWWWRKWERLNAGESNGKLPLRICPGCSVPEPYQSPDWALVSAQTGPRAEYL